MDKDECKEQREEAEALIEGMREKGFQAGVLESRDMWLVHSAASAYLARYLLDEVSDVSDELQTELSDRLVRAEKMLTPMLPFGLMDALERVREVSQPKGEEDEIE